MWPQKSLPALNTPPEDAEEAFETSQAIRDAVHEVQEILRGNTTIGGPIGADSLTNCDSVIIEVVWAIGDSAVKSVPNPLGRELQGVVLLQWAGDVEPVVASGLFNSSLGVIAGSIAISDSSSGFTSAMENGTLIVTGSASAPTTINRIAQVVSSSSAVLDEAWPGSTESGNSGILAFPLLASSFYLVASPSTYGIWAHYLLF